MHTPSTHTAPIALTPTVPVPRQAPVRAVGLRRLLVGVGGLTLGAATLVVGAAAVMGHTITRPQRIKVAEVADLGQSIEAIAFRTSDGLTLDGWYLPAAQPRDAIIICHGFSMNRNELLELARGLREHGHAVLLFDFRAHGTSEGRRSTIGYQEADDIGAALGFLRGRPELAGLRIGVAGISMGAAAALLAAARQPDLAAVVADSSFASLHAIAANGLRVIYRLPPFPLAPLVVRFGEFFSRTRIRLNRPIDAVPAVAPRPLLLIHCAGDELIPAADARALYAAAGEPKELWLVPGLGHAYAFLHDPAEYLRRLDAFFRRTLRESQDHGVAPAAG